MGERAYACVQPAIQPDAVAREHRRQLRRGPLALTIPGDGALFAQVAITGCPINGTASTIDACFKIYSVSLATLNCASEIGVPDGATLEAYRRGSGSCGETS